MMSDYLFGTYIIVSDVLHSHILLGDCPPVPYTFSTYNGTVMGCRSQYRYRYETPSSDHPGGYPQLKPYT